jgi:hypothetical protein
MAIYCIDEKADAMEIQIIARATPAQEERRDPIP